jgi:hypothetical protein
MDSIYYKESLKLFGTYVAAFVLLILQGFHIKQKELIGHKIILILQGIKVLFNKDSSTIIFLRYFSLSYAANSENYF